MNTAIFIQTTPGSVEKEKGRVGWSLGQSLGSRLGSRGLLMPLLQVSNCDGGRLSNLHHFLLTRDLSKAEDIMGSCVMWCRPSDVLTHHQVLSYS
jgi:hypothetical protein